MICIIYSEDKISDTFKKTNKLNISYTCKYFKHKFYTVKSFIHHLRSVKKIPHPFGPKDIDCLLVPPGRAYWLLTGNLITI